MRIIEWEKTKHRTSKASMSDFFDHLIPEITLFKFKTSDFPVSPHGGEFSIKTIISGAESYEFCNRRVALVPNQTLLVNEGQEYSSSIEQESESLSIFYGREDVASAATLLERDDEQLLDNPKASASVAYEAPQVPYINSPETATVFQNLLKTIKMKDCITAEEHARDYLVKALGLSFQKTPNHKLTDVKKRSTRDELLTRVLRAKEKIDELNGHGCTLELMAEAACLSKYHFLRIFREVYGVSPMAYARRARLEAARRDLRRGMLQKDVARRAGYSNYQVFVRAYKNVFGFPPDTAARN